MLKLIYLFFSIIFFVKNKMSLYNLLKKKQNNFGIEEKNIILIAI